MKILYLARHAKSDWSNQSIPDFARPLNKRGKRDAPFIGEVLKQKNVHPDLIISSPAKRAKKTAIAIAKKIDYPEKDILYLEEIYEASSSHLYKVINKLDDQFNSVMIFGHNPGLTLLNNQISDRYIDNIPTCGVVALEIDDIWGKISKNNCKYLYFEYPKLYFNGS